MARNRFIGSWTERQSERIDLPFDLASARTVLGWATGPNEAQYTHRDIAHWCDRFWCAFMDVDTEEPMITVIRILGDVDCQWDLYLANTYSLNQLQELDLDSVRLPTSWFSQWLDELPK